MKEIFVLKSSKQNVWENLAFETFLHNKISSDYEKNGISTDILFLWQNDKTVVIGKHQNPYKECNLDFIRKNNINIARRITGGGAVYHDIGNLNFSFIQTKDLYDKSKNFEIIKNALGNLGIETEISGRNDILLNGRKFSGNAFYNTKNGGIHHGTILIASDEKIISQCLTPDKYKLKSKGVSSIKSRICNLSEIFPHITADKISEEIIKEFGKNYAAHIKTEIETDDNEIKILYEKYSSKNWIFKDYIDNGLEFSHYFDWGSITISLLLKNDIIADINIISDSLETNIIDSLLFEMKNRKFSKSDIQSIFENYNSKIANDIKNLLLSNIE